MKTLNFFRNYLIVSVTTMLAAFTSCVSADWESVPTLDVTLFNPGYASWERVLTAADHEGAKGIRGRKTCLSCHDGDQEDIANAILDSDHQFHNPIFSGNSHLKLTLQVRSHQQGLQWRVKLPSNVDKGVLSLLMEAGSVATAPLFGCWAGCHSDMQGMPDNKGEARLKYLGNSRQKMSRTGGGDDLVSLDDLTQALKDGSYLVLNRLKFDQSKVSSYNGYILEERHEQNSSEQALVEVVGQDRILVWVQALPDTAKDKLKEGGVLGFGVALHQQDASGLNHIVSFGYTVGLSEEADLNLVESE